MMARNRQWRAFFTPLDRGKLSRALVEMLFACLAIPLLAALRSPPPISRQQAVLLGGRAAGAAAASRRSVPPAAAFTEEDCAPVQRSNCDP